MSAAIPLLGWQKRYVEDDSRRKLLVKSVQIGGSFGASLECTLDSFTNRGLWIMLSASDRQSMELIEKVKMHTAGAGVVVDSGFFGDTSIVQHTAKFPNGARIIGLPANADTARGYSGNVLLDEFAIHRDARAIWKAMVGRTMRGYKLRVVSSFKGTGNKFYELAKDLGLHEGRQPDANPVKKGVWSGHWCDIHMAVREGLNVDVDELREAVGDDEIFAEEFECRPVDGALEFIPLDLVIGCETEESSIDFDYQRREWPLYAGFDVARKRDLSQIWILEEQPERLLTRGLITMARTRFSTQFEVASAVARCVDRLSIDSTGIGAMLAEQLVKEFPGVVEPVQFTGPVKERMATELKKRFEDRTIAIPEAKSIRRAIQSVKRFVGPTGNIRYDAARTDAGHADEFWALALAVAASSQGGRYVPASEGGLIGEPVMGGLMGREF